MSLLQNLLRAETAVKYVEQHLRGKASNKPEDIFHTLQRNLIADYGETDPEGVGEILGMPVVVRTKCHEIHLSRITEINNKRDARREVGERLNAGAIIRDGLGNCFEHAVLACHYLNGIGVSSYMVTADDSTNHVFVVIGVAGGLDGTTVNVAPNAAPGAPLGTGTSVVCDPWYHEWFAIQQDWAHKMNRILSTTNKRNPPVLPAQIPLTLTSSIHVT
jgi:hypothetical protein